MFVLHAMEEHSLAATTRAVAQVKDEGVSGSSSLLVSSHKVEVRWQPASHICIVQEAHMRHGNLQLKIHQLSVLVLGGKESTLKCFLYPSFRVAWGGSRTCVRISCLEDITLSHAHHRLPASGSSSYGRRSSFSCVPPQASLGWCLNGPGALAFQSLRYRLPRQSTRNSNIVLHTARSSRINHKASILTL